MIDKCTALTATQNEPEKIDPEERASNDLPEPELPDPELPDLTRLYKRRCRDENVIKKAKTLLYRKSGSVQKPQIYLLR